MPSLSLVEGWHAPAGRRTCETLASDPGQADQTGSAGGARKPGPGRQIVSQDNSSASAESKVRPGPRPLTLRPHHRKTAEAGPEALSTVSLPTMRPPVNGEFGPAEVHRMAKYAAPTVGCSVMGSAG